ncbi:RcnB family protein [Sphingomonas glaciei]|uniref:RcnB family protein n=1 Tax=Sphingomonas glaciei TaxID=2938948 RepID=A0ABY5MRM4_9SPHN|nr:RcnB family protein [Sphingomonas glaciei]UUR07032.1 RcnB family protein [Sphingomonas glaciei]
MRLSLLSSLLLTAAIASGAAAQPASEEPLEQAAAPRPPEPEPRAERQSRDADASPRPARSEWSERREQPREVEVMPQAPPPPREERAERFEPRQASPDPVAATAVARPRREDRGRPSEDVAGFERRANGAGGAGWRGGNDEGRSRIRDVPPSAGSPVYGNAIPSPVTVTRPSREVSPGSVTAGNLRDRVAADGLRRDRAGRDSWRRDWRQDRRYDWRRHRDRDRSRFHLSVYIDPFGWRYRDYDIGWQLPARYYASRYWILDPYSYRLPPVSGPYRWIRYHDDVLLVDLRTGRVLDRIRDFFW